MAEAVKNIAIIGANKEGLKLLPLLLGDAKSKVILIADSNKEAMLFKLKELGYVLSSKFGIKVTNDLGTLKKTKDIHTIINALGDIETEKFLEAPEFRDIEKLAPLSARLLWGVAAKVQPSRAMNAGDHAQLLNSLHEIVDAVRLTVDRKELLSVVLKLATESTGAERGSIMLIEREDGQLRVEIAKGMDDEVIRKIRVPLGVGISGKVAKEGKPIIISGRAEESGFSIPSIRADVKSAMCVPLIVNREVIGVINVSSNESAHTFTQDDLNFLTSLSIQAAEVIQRSNEYEKLRVDAAKFTFWKEIDSIISSPQLIDKSLAVVAKRLQQVVPGLTCFIYIYDANMSKLFLRAASIKDVKGMGGYGFLSLRKGEGMEGAGLESGKDIILVDRTEEANTKRVYLSLPMIAGGVHVGTLCGHIVCARGLSVYHESFLKEIRTLLAESIYKYKQNEEEKSRSREMFAVDEAGIEMTAIKDRKMLMTVIATTPAAIIGAEGSILRFKQDEARKYQMEATYGLDDRQIREYFLPFEKDTVLEVLRKKAPVVREFSEETSPYIRSILSFPLMCGGS
ncbi:GAF domain-containing protein, partial [bacterium]